MRQHFRKQVRYLSVGAAAVAFLILPLSSTPARAEVTDTAVLLEILAFVQTYVVPVLEALAALPDTLDGGILAATQQPIGEDGDSYLTTTGPGRFARLFPDDPTAFAPDDASRYAAERELDRKARVNEAMDEAEKVTADQEAAATRLDGDALRNANPFESLAGIGHLGNQIAIEEAGSLKELTALTAEAAQLEADQRLQEDWQRRQQDAWLRDHYGSSGYWAGERTWQPETMHVAW